MQCESRRDGPSCSRGFNSVDMRFNPVGMIHFVAADFNPWTWRFNPVGMIRIVAADFNPWTWRYNS